MKVLFLTTVLPAKRRTGGEIVSQLFVNALIDGGCEVDLLGYVRSGDDYQLAAMEKRVAYRVIESDSSRSQAILWLAEALLNNRPYSLQKYISGSYRELVRSLTSRTKYDIVVIDHEQVAFLLRDVRSRGKLVYIAHNVEFQIYEKLMSSAKSVLSRWVNARESRLLRTHEAELVNAVDAIWTLTHDDKRHFEAICPGKQVDNYDIPSYYRAGEPGRKSVDVCMLGTWSWDANRKGLLWFFEQVYPLLRKDLSISVAGKGADWLDGRYPNVIYRGFIDDPGEFFDSAKVISIPSVTGGGVQVKTIDAISTGNYVVATNVAMRGISEFPSSVMVVDDAKGFADSIESIVARDMTKGVPVDAISWGSERFDAFNKKVRAAALMLLEG